VQLGVAVEPSGRDLRQPQRAGAARAQHRPGGHDAPAQREVAVVAPPRRPARLHDGAPQIGGRGGTDRCAVQGRAAPGAGGVGFAQRRGGQHPEQGLPIVQQPQRDAPAGSAASEVAGAVDGIHHPAQGAAPGRALLLALETVLGEVARDGIRYKALNRAIRLGQPILRTLQRPRAGARGREHGECQGSGVRADGAGDVEPAVERDHAGSLLVGIPGLRSCVAA